MSPRSGGKLVASGPYMCPGDFPLGTLAVEQDPDYFYCLLSPVVSGCQVSLGWGFSSWLCSLHLGPTLNAQLASVSVLTPARGTDRDVSHEAEHSSPQAD